MYSKTTLLKKGTFCACLLFISCLVFSFTVPESEVPSGNDVEGSMDERGMDLLMAMMGDHNGTDLPLHDGQHSSSQIK